MVLFQIVQYVLLHYPAAQARTMDFSRIKTMGSDELSGQGRKKARCFLDAFTTRGYLGLWIHLV
jgi:hypothetical protein